MSIYWLVVNQIVRQTFDGDSNAQKKYNNA